MIGFYGECGVVLVDENLVLGEGFFVDICVVWEDVFWLVCEFGVRVLYVRLGVVLILVGGVLRKMLLFFWWGLGGWIGLGM